MGRVGTCIPSTLQYHISIGKIALGSCLFFSFLFSFCLFTYGVQTAVGSVAFFVVLLAHRGSRPPPPASLDPLPILVIVFAGSKISMTAPVVVTPGSDSTMQFIMPKEFKKIRLVLLHEFRVSLQYARGCSDASFRPRKLFEPTAVAGGVFVSLAWHSAAAVSSFYLFHPAPREVKLGRSSHSPGLHRTARPAHPASYLWCTGELLLFHSV